MIKVVHVITGLSTGGAEMMLYKLITKMNPDHFTSEVISLTDIGPVGEKIKDYGVPVQALGMRRGIPEPLALLRLAGLYRERAPHVIQTWMYHADLIGGLAAKLAGNIPVIWNIRHSNLEPGYNKASTIWTARICAMLSRWLPTRIICCSDASRRIHAKLGYVAEKMINIPNGFNLDCFHPNPAARLSFREVLGIPADALLIGLIGRFDLQKDHQNFIQAAGHLCSVLNNVHFVLCGDDVTWENAKLAGWIDAAGIRKHCHLLGRRNDMPNIFAALDIVASSSCGEGFPNVIGEAMASGVPCVVTDVGDSAFIVGETGIVVPPKKPLELAEACRKLVEIGPEGRSRSGLAARRRVEELFSLPVIIARYQNLYEEHANYHKP